MSHLCFSCGNEVEVTPGTPIGRTEECPKCGADLHVCRNCKFYDPQIYNECRETQAERVTEKDRSNFCDYFTFVASGDHVQSQSSDADKASNALDKLFK